MLDAAQLLVFKAELVSDPKALGYAALLSVGNDSGVATLVNAIGSGGAFQVPNEPVTASTVLANITPTDLAAMTSTQVQNLSLYLTAQTIDLSTNGGNNLANVLSCLPNPGTSRTTVTNLSVRQGTRGEVLFGINGIRVVANDVSNAMSS